MTRPTIRPAEPRDVPLLLGLIRELAEYERLSDEVSGNEDSLRSGLFGEGAPAEAALAHVGAEPAGFALFFTTFSTFLCRSGIWIEDLFVRPEQRRAGIGRSLLAHVARRAVERGCGRLEWSVLDWNEPAIAFYRSLGSRAMREWTTHRLDGDALHRLAAS